ncbi:class I SAM-dependent methyltransferase [Flavobacterium sp. NKUCC04_CG]|uniref:class I SAM-dependent methyltransferase n=1 Tax=Flavobacterium sp. NKUCC04_CG TaxID=2842121 RepID=UPI001C5ABFAF|nr:class I SAM-dependent methyltransferase [Flavobacterium sp. NKUCC04_CG]MBW3517679.1 class I SAM-dependent methyltransferase [Flavobacterium sp. NKUCC04_CG]
MYEQTYPTKRFQITLNFIEKHLSKSDRILDLGVDNPLSQLMRSKGFDVKNTQGEDLDNDFSALSQQEYTVLTAFEIFEHLLNPYTVLKNAKAEKIILSVPLRLWFSRAYQSKTDLRDRHYHEFESWQFDWLLEKSGYRILDRKQWAHPVGKLGFRPILRLFTPRYYMVYAEKIR